MYQLVFKIVIGSAEENLTNAQFEQLQKFFETAPSLSHTFSVINPNTGKESEFVIEGLASFFGQHSFIIHWKGTLKLTLL